MAQDAVMRAAEQWTRIRMYARPWIVRVATNLSIAQLRRASRSMIVLVDEAAVDESAELRLDVAGAVAALPVRQRQAVVLRYLADLDEATVASLLGCSRGSVKRHLHRATQTLRKSPRLVSSTEKETSMDTTHWTDHGFIAASEPPTGWPARPWDHWFVAQSESLDRVAVDAAGAIVLDADGDEVMSGPGFNFDVVKVLPRSEPDPPAFPDPRPGFEDKKIRELLNRALQYAAFFGHPWVGDEHLGLALAERGELPGIKLPTLEAAIARFYEGPWAPVREAIVQARKAGENFVRQPDDNFDWNRSINQTVHGASTTADIATALLTKAPSFIRFLLDTQTA